MIHYEYNDDEGKVIAYDVEEIKCKRIDGARETHWIDPEELCNNPKEAHAATHAALVQDLEDARVRLERFRAAPTTVTTRTAK